MLTVIFLFCAIVLYGTMLKTYGAQSNYSNGMIFAVTLPKEAANHHALQSIRARFKKEMRNAGIVFLAALIPMLFLEMSFQVVYFLLWTCAASMIFAVPFRRAHRAALALKRENDWFVGAKRVLQTDLRAMMLKHKGAAPVWLFAIPLALAVLLTVWLTKQELMFLGIASIASVILLALTSLVFRNARTKVYSRNSELNVSLNQAGRRIWSYTFLSLAFAELIHCLLISGFVLSDREALSNVWLAASLAFTLVPLALLFNASSRIKRMVDEALEADGKTIYTDDDEYWGNGFTYHNPHDRRVFVEKRVGVGMTVNTGTAAGKWIIGSTIGIAAAVVLGVCFLLVRSELTPPVLSVTEDRQIHIDYLMYSIDFPAEAMRDVALVEEMPRGRRINGEATDKVARGHFNLEEYGKSRLYLYKNNPPYIRIQLEDGYIFYNEPDPEETGKVYEQLRRLMEER